MIKLPRIMVAGTQSGVGKTSVTLALVHALKRRGLKVQTFKAGPDFLDPTYLALASGADCYNLDGWMMGRDYLLSLFADKSSWADIAVIEGVMGLFDGAIPGSSMGSSAQLARWLGAPVALVADAGGMSRSFTAMIKGYADFEKNVCVAGAIANNCGSGNHINILRQNIEKSDVPPLLGGIIRGAVPTLPRRHLGLLTANGKALTTDMLDQMAVTLESAVSIDKMIEIARSAVRIPASPLDYGQAGQAGPVARLGVAFDDAFHFYYKDNLQALESAGMEIEKFSPIHDGALPDGLDALYFGGGYPEEYAGALSDNIAMLESVRRFSESGKPVYAECGGLIYLARGVEDVEGNRYPFAGLLPSWTKLSKKFTSLGYVEATLTDESLFGVAGDSLRGHRFHYSRLVDEPPSDTGWKKVYTLAPARGGEQTREGYQNGRRLASYAHIHFASRPQAVSHFTNFIMERR